MTAKLPCKEAKLLSHEHLLINPTVTHYCVWTEMYIFCFKVCKKLREICQKMLITRYVSVRKHLSAKMLDNSFAIMKTNFIISHSCLYTMPTWWTPPASKILREWATFTLSQQFLTSQFRIMFGKIKYILSDVKSNFSDYCACTISLMLNSLLKLTDYPQ